MKRGSFPPAAHDPRHEPKRRVGRPPLKPWKRPQGALRDRLYTVDPTDPALRVWVLGLLPDSHRLPDQPALPHAHVHAKVCERLAQRAASPGERPFAQIKGRCRAMAIMTPIRI